MFDFLLRTKAHSKQLLPDGVDMHSHILPGVDDGSPDTETSLTIIRHLIQSGLTGACCTPHIMLRYPGNTPASLRQRFDTFRQTIDQHLGPGIHNPYVETQLRCLPDAHILARILGRHIQGCACPAYRRRHPGHSRSNIHKLLRDGTRHSLYPRQQVGYRRLIVRGVPQKVDNENFYVVITAFFRKFVKWRRSA